MNSVKKDLANAIAQRKPQEEIGRLEKKLKKFGRKVRAAFCDLLDVLRCVLPFGVVLCLVSFAAVL